MSHPDHITLNQSTFSATGEPSSARRQLDASRCDLYDQWLRTDKGQRASLLVYVSCGNDEEVLRDNLPVDCGQRPNLPPFRSRFSTGKREAIPHSWPWHVGVYSTFFGKFPFCGGTLIAPNWVLTAAHCIISIFNCTPVPVGRLFNAIQLTGEILAVRVGDHDYTVDTTFPRGHLVEKVILHPSLNPDNPKLGFDVALLKLQRAVRPGARVQYACLPESYLVLSVGAFCYFAGWGDVIYPRTGQELWKTEKLLEARVPLVGNDECREAHKKVRDLRHICTDATYGEACNGDSGGGLHCLDSHGKWIV
ncbi:hypothetical protein SprV_0802515000 [Sparganum proliferum]